MDLSSNIFCDYLNATRIVRANREIDVLKKKFFSTTDNGIKISLFHEIQTKEKFITEHGGQVVEFRPDLQLPPPPKEQVEKIEPKELVITFKAYPIDNPLIEKAAENLLERVKGINATNNTIYSKRNMLSSTRIINAIDEVCSI